MVVISAKFQGAWLRVTVQGFSPEFAGQGSSLGVYTTGTTSCSGRCGQSISRMTDAHASKHSAAARRMRTRRCENA